MGIVNASPESFSDGWSADASADLIARVARAVQLLEDGADILDVGGQSAITKVPELDEREEVRRVVPLIEAIVRRAPGAVISVDTYRPAVASAAVDAGAAIVNDVSALLYPDVAAICARTGAALVVMHTRARPKQRLQDPALYDDIAGGVAGDVVALLRERLEVAREHGVADESLIVDPGIDFSKTPPQSVEVLRHLDGVLDLGLPCLLAISRKDFIGALTGRSPRQRLPGTLATVGYVGWRPGVIYRVHDVAATVDYLAVLGALGGAINVPRDLRLADDLRHERRD
jgi:dihydropteroate synthase